jgi:hypothetical protein
MEPIQVGELLGLLGLVGSIAGVYAGTKAEASKLAASFNAMADAMKQIRDDIHAMRKELRDDLKAHSNKLDDLNARVAVVEMRVKP